MIDKSRRLDTAIARVDAIWSRLKKKLKVVRRDAGRVDPTFKSWGG
jgi:hypothetical protein